MASVKHQARGTKAILNQAIEALEPRKLLSASTAGVLTESMHPFATPAFTGFTPAQVRTSYGFNTVSDDGSGETIAIVDAFADPDITSDLQAFDAKYGISNPTFNIFDEFGNQNPPAFPLPGSIQEDDTWAIETSLDVEWAHAMAPGATIDLYEADSDSGLDLYTAAADAAANPNVSVVSMSWGGSEDPLEGDADVYFKTSVGHQGVTFIASSGDDGMTGVSYPGSSPNVLSVGGTSLKQYSGVYSSERVWAGSVGGESMYEPAPAYQSALGLAHRSVPDVSYDADPNTGFSIDDSIGYLNADGVTRTSGFFDIGGTSAGAPQWAAIIADTNEARAANGLGTLNGASETLPAVYSLYGVRRHTAAYSIYHTDFNDITVGQTLSEWALGNGGSLAVPGFSSQTLFDDGFSGYHATPGYDEATGLGTPQVGNLINALSDYSAPVEAVAAPLTRAARRRLQAELAAADAHAKAAIERPGQDVGVNVQTQNSTPAETPMAMQPVIRPDSLGHMANVDAPSTVLPLASTPAVGSSAAPAISTLALGNGIRFGGIGYASQQMAVTTPSALSIAALPDIAVTNLETLLQSSAATTYSTSLQLVRMDAVTQLADAVSLFARHTGSSTLLDMDNLSVAMHQPTAVILGVLAVDAVLLGRALRRRRWTLDRGWIETPFSLAVVPADE